MLWTTLVLLGLTVAVWRVTRTLSDQVAQCLGIATSLICLLLGLAIAPILLKSLVFLALLMYPILPHRRYGTY